jgi:hypothetical protein
VATSGLNNVDLGEGEGALVLVGFLIPVEVGWGKFQPHIRYQGFDGKFANCLESQWDFGVNYVMKEHNARVSLIYSIVNVRNAANPGGLTGPPPTPLGRSDTILIGTQFQF